MKRFAFDTYSTDGGPIPYVRTGSGPTLFLIPAFRSDIERFAPLIRYLSAWFDVIVPELPGIGCTATLGGKPYTTDNFADLYIGLIRSLKIKSFMLGGFCLGGIIVMKMLQKGVRPTNVLLFETFTNGNQLHLYRHHRMLLPFIRLAKHSRIMRSGIARFLGNKRVISGLTRMVFYSDRDSKRIVSYQTRVTMMMNADTTVDIVNEMVDMDLFSEGAVRYPCPAILLFFSNDPLIDTHAASKDLQQVFSRVKEVRVHFEDHAPKGPLTDKQVSSLMSEVIGDLRTFVSGTVGG